MRTRRAWLVFGLAVLGCEDAGLGQSDSGPKDAPTVATDAAADTGPLDGLPPDTGSVAPPTSFLPSARSGARLKARMIGPENGVGIFVEFYDSLLNHVCDFKRLVDGSYRCVPKLYGTIRYYDATCEGERFLVHSNPTCGISRFFADRVRTAPICDRPAYETQVLALAATPTTTPYYRRFSDEPDRVSCLGPSFAPASSAGLSAVGAELDPSMFVRGDVDYEGDGVELGVVAINAEDGARLVIGVHDPEFGPCSAYASGSAPVQCHPKHEAVGGVFFFDAACETSAAVVLHAGRSCDYEEVVRVCESGTECRHYRLGSEITEGPLFYGNACEPRTVAETIENNPGIFRINEIGPEVFLKDVHIEKLGTGRLSPMYEVRPDGRPLLPLTRGGGRFYARATETTCQAYRVAGTWRCVPVQAGRPRIVRGFSDAECTTPLLESFDDPGEFFLQAHSGSCRAFGELELEDIKTVIGPYVGPTYEIGAGGCVAAGPADETQYRVGPSVADTFAPLQEWYD